MSTCKRLRLKWYIYTFFVIDTRTNIYVLFKLKPTLILYELVLKLEVMR